MNECSGKESLFFSTWLYRLPADTDASVIENAGQKTAIDTGVSDMEKYSSGRRGAPAKGVDRVSGAGVQIPPSPFKRKERNWK